MQQLILAYRRRPQDIFLRAFADAVRRPRCSLPDDIVKRHLLSDRITITKDTWKRIPSGSRSLFAAAQHRQTVRHLSRFRFTSTQTKKIDVSFLLRNQKWLFCSCLKWAITNGVKDRLTSALIRWNPDESRCGVWTGRDFHRNRFRRFECDKNRRNWNYYWNPNEEEEEEEKGGSQTRARFRHCDTWYYSIRTREEEEEDRGVGVGGVGDDQCGSRRRDKVSKSIKERKEEGGQK